MPSKKKRVNQRRISAAVITGASILLVTACGSTATTASNPATTTASSPATGTPKNLSLAYVPGATGNPFYDTLELGAKKEASALGMSFSYQGSPDFAPSTQIPVVEAVCDRHPSALLVAPTDPVALRPAIAQCMHEGVAVVLVDTSLTDTSGIVSAITSDNVQGGEAAGQLIGQDLHGKGQVAILAISATATTQVERAQGLKQELAAHYPGITVQSTQYVQQAESSSVTTASSLLSAHPDLGAFFGIAGPSAQGAAQAITSAHLKGKVIDVGYDAEPAAVQLLKSGDISALVMQQPALEGSTGVQYAYDYLTGQKSKIKSSVELPNVLATTATAGSSSISKYFYAA
jgi:ribose transport system substrate-binding protein